MTDTPPVAIRWVGKNTTKSSPAYCHTVTNPEWYEVYLNRWAECKAALSLFKENTKDRSLARARKKLQSNDDTVEIGHYSMDRCKSVVACGLCLAQQQIGYPIPHTWTCMKIPTRGILCKCLLATYVIVCGPKWPSEIKHTTFFFSFEQSSHRLILVGHRSFRSGYPWKMAAEFKQSSLCSHFKAWKSGNISGNDPEVWVLVDWWATNPARDINLMVAN